MSEVAVVIGAGPAGLAAASELQRRGVDALVLERGPSVATTWRARHDHLSLNTHRWFSHQPGQRIPRAHGTFPRRDDYVAYLETCSASLRIDVDTNVTSIAQTDSGWRIATADRSIDTVHLIIATGPDLEPVMPDIPGNETFTGHLMHAGAFATLADADNKVVLIVGPGNSGVDLLNHLVDLNADELWLSARSGMNIVPARWFGVPLHPIAVAARYLPIKAQDATLRVIQRLAFGDLTRYGYATSTIGALTRVRLDGVAPAIDNGFVAGLKAGRVKIRPGSPESKVLTWLSLTEPPVGHI